MTIPSQFSQILPGELAVTPPVISLLVANLVTILFAIAGHWNAATVMFIYWVQSVIIGIFTVVTLLTVDTAALGSDMEKALAEKGGSGTVGTWYVRFYKAVLAGFFALHYGLFHWAYYGFIVETGLFGAVDVSNPEILLATGIFFANHLYSFIYHRHEGRQGATFVTEEFFRPYQRIIPMHMTIIFGSILLLALSLVGIDATLPVLVLFLLLKTYADITTHVVKHLVDSGPAASDGIP
jgi:hypothetical protein